MKRLFLLILLATIQAASAEHIWLHDGERLIYAEVARSDAERARGLMYRLWLPPNSGMLFVFDPPEPVTFWMKNTLIPLEMRFYTKDHAAFTRYTALPCTMDPCPHYPARGLISYVLETRSHYRLLSPRPLPLQLIFTSVD
ncbi:MAG: DUF192 domain-containing protein [Cardiobacteriaceae bacterium]|nr:DUF192 domain-containing protein [Cardiobacteriaceae bacterium]